MGVNVAKKATPRGDDAENRRQLIKRGAMAAVAVLALGIVISLVFAFRFIEEDKQRDLQAWQVRLDIVAESRRAVIQEWLTRQLNVAGGLASNVSLKLYLTQINLAKKQAGDTPINVAAEISFLRNLITAAALRNGFAPLAPPTINANMETVAAGGIGLLSPNGDVVVASRGFLSRTDNLETIPQTSRKDGTVIHDYFKDGTGAFVITVTAPVLAVQGEAEKDEALGYIVAQRPVGQDFFMLLEQPGDTSKTGKTYLVQKNKSKVRYISPTTGEKSPTGLDLKTPNLAAAYALLNPGTFGTMRDWNGSDVLMTSRQIADTPWVLIRSVAAKEALADTYERVENTIWGYIITVLALSAGFIAAWRHGSSVTAAAEAKKYKIASERFETAAKFGRIVADSQPEKIAVVDKNGDYTFANRTILDEFGMEPDDLKGKNLASILGPSRAEALMATNRYVLDTMEAVRQIYAFETSKGEEITRVNHVPLRGDRDYPPGVLMVMDDITEMVKEKQVRESTLRELVSTLVKLVDERDPYSANHSLAVSKLAVALAREMSLTEKDQRTLDLAGNLINIGKTTVPAETLTHQGSLTHSQLAQVREGILRSAEFIKSIPFDVPVYETLQQVAEHWDGHGFPRGLTGNEIGLPARILAVANAFIALISDRAHRKGLPPREACDVLMKSADQQFDRKPLGALISYLENRGGLEEINNVIERFRH